MQAEVICDRRGYYVDRGGRSYYSGEYWINSCIRWAQQEATMYEEQAKELKKNTPIKSLLNHMFKKLNNTPQKEKSLPHKKLKKNTPERRSFNPSLKMLSNPSTSR